MAKICDHENEDGTGCDRPVFSKRKCRYHWGKLYAKPISHTPKEPISRESAKRAVQNRQYATRRKVWITEPENQYCKAKLPGCLHIATECHHMQGRDGDLILDETKWLPVCPPCHDWITEHSKQAIEMGLSLIRNT